MRSIWRVILIYNFRDGRIIIKRILSIVVMLAFILMTCQQPMPWRNNQNIKLIWL